MAEKSAANQINIGPLALEVIVASASKNYFSGKAKSVSSVNSVGPFDILPQHENFISLISDKVKIQDVSGKNLEFPIEKGLLEVSFDKVRIFVGI